MPESVTKIAITKARNIAKVSIVGTAGLAYKKLISR